MSALSTIPTYGYQAVIWTPTALTLVAVSARMAIRARARLLAADDNLMLAASVFLIVTTSLCQTIVQSYELADLRAPQPNQISTEEAFALTFGFLTIGIAKASVALQLLSILGHLSRWREVLLIACLPLILVFTAVQLPLAVLPACDGDIRQTCLAWNTKFVFGNIYDIFNVLLDCLYGVIPAVFVLRLPVPVYQRVILLALCGLGFVAGTLTLVRLIYLDAYGVASDHAALLDLVAIWLERAIVMVSGSIAAIASVPEHCRRVWCASRARASSRGKAGVLMQSANGNRKASSEAYASDRMHRTDWPLRGGRRIYGREAVPTIHLEYEFGKVSNWRLSGIVPPV